MDAIDAFANLGYQGLSQMVSNSVNSIYSNLQNKRNFEYAKKINEMNLDNLKRVPSLMRQGLQRAGMNPAMTGGDLSQSVTASFTPTQMSAAPTESLMALRNLDAQNALINSQSALSKIQVMREEDFDREINAFLASSVFSPYGDPTKRQSKGTLDAMMQAVQYAFNADNQQAQMFRNALENWLNKERLDNKDFLNSVIQKAIEEYRNVTEDGRNKRLSNVMQALQIQMASNGNILNYLDKIESGNFSYADFAKLATLTLLGQDGGLFKLSPFSLRK